MAEPNIAKVTMQMPVPTTIFRPNPQTINQFDSVFWSNETTESHQPAPDGGADNQWVSQPIPPKGQSSQVVFETTGTTGKVIPGYFKMRTHSADFAGKFVNHCQILAQEDRGMMQLIEVVDNKTQVIHH